MGKPQGHRWLRGHGSNADLLVQSQAWYQFHHLALVLTVGFEPTLTAVDEVDTLDADDRAWLEERLQEYRELLTYLCNH